MTSIFIQQLNTLFSVYAGNYINTGNKVVDNAFMTIASTIFMTFLSFIVFLTTKGGWRVCMRRCLRSAPTDFNPKSFEVPSEFRFTVPFSTEVEVMLFCKWIVDVNSDKLNKGGIILACGLANALDCQCDSGSNSSRVQNENYANTEALILSVTKSLETPVPIWIGTDGIPVFAVKNLYNSSTEIQDLGINDYRTFSLCSNSKESIYEVMKTVLSTDPELKRKVVDSKRLKVYQVEITQSPRDDKVRNKEIGYINPNKTFDMLFFEQKDTLLNILDGILNRNLYPEHTKTENRIGILLHGPPGTGKTGVIQAIANYTKRHIININLNHVKSCSALDSIMNIDRKTHMFVFEEIDTMGELVFDRKTVVPKSSNASEIQELKEMVSSMNANKYGPPRTEKKLDTLTLGYLLQKIDGLISNEDTIFVASSNHPERLDPAMLRPGRFGFHLNLSYCSRKMLGDIIGMMCQMNDEEKDVFMRKIPMLACDVWSPTEIIQQCLIEKFSSDKMLKFLKSQHVPER